MDHASIVCNIIFLLVAAALVEEQNLAVFENTPFLSDPLGLNQPLSAAVCGALCSGDLF